MSSDKQQLDLAIDHMVGEILGRIPEGGQSTVDFLRSIQQLGADLEVKVDRYSGNRERCARILARLQADASWCAFQQYSTDRLK